MMRADPELLVHLYRGQMSRANTWRMRLDTTTNWAVIITAALLTWSFASRTHPHYVLLIGLVATSSFLLIETRRYRQYDVWRYRVRLLEEHLFVPELGDDEPDCETWQRKLRRDLDSASMKMPYREALARRLRRVHLAIAAVLLLAWLAKVAVFARDEMSLLEAMRIEMIPGAAVAVAVGTYAVLTLAIAVWPHRRHAKGEVEDDGKYDHKHD